MPSIENTFKKIATRKECVFRTYHISIVEGEMNSAYVCGYEIRYKGQEIETSYGYNRVIPTNVLLQMAYKSINEFRKKDGL